MKKSLFFTLSILSYFQLFCQSGTVGDPFTDLSQVNTVPANGTYFFDIGGITFSTYIEVGGWVLVASGSLSTTESIYATTTTLTLQSDEILPLSIYTLSNIDKVRMNATAEPNLPFDVESTATAVLDNLKSDITLSVGTDSPDWTGTGTARLTRTCPSANESINSIIYHACGNGNGLHWAVGADSPFEEVAFMSGKNDLNLWVSAGTILPVKLMSFKAFENKGEVQLQWQTASENNNRGFVVERSLDAKNWEKLLFLAGYNSTTQVQYYSFLDNNPHQGINYYRLRQMDYNGQFNFSDIRLVELQKTKLQSEIYVYPNPVSGNVLKLNITSPISREYNVSIFDSTGERWYSRSVFLTENTFNIEELPSGVFFLIVLKDGKRFVKKFVVNR